MRPVMTTCNRRFTLRERPAGASRQTRSILFDGGDVGKLVVKMPR